MLIKSFSLQELLKEARINPQTAKNRTINQKTNKTVPNGI